MVRLFGRTLTRRQIAERFGSLSQFAGVRLMTLGDGVERGIRMLEFRTGSGLRFTVLVDRAMDIAECEYKGQAIGWHSPAGFRHPALHEYEGEDGLAWARSFSGFLVTCGRTFRAGQYALGIEPSTHHVLGDLAARERGEMIWLERGMSRDYHVVLRGLDGAQEIAEAESEIRRAAAQPQEDYPQPTGDFMPLGGRP